MSQTTVSLTAPRDRAPELPATNRVIHWVFVAIGVVAPLLLVAIVGLTSGDALERAQLIVQGTERLALLLMGAVLVNVLYMLGVREARLVAGEPEAAQAY